MEFAYDGGGMGKGGNVTLYYDGKEVGKGRVDQTQGVIFSADETTDVGYETGTTVSPDYTAHTSRFTGKINWVQIDLGEDAKTPTTTSTPTNASGLRWLGSSLTTLTSGGQASLGMLHPALPRSRAGVPPRHAVTRAANTIHRNRNGVGFRESARRRAWCASGLNRRRPRWSLRHRGRVTIDVCQHHMRARSGRPPADAATDTKRPARHHGDLAGKSRGSHADSLFGDASATFFIDGHQLAIEPPPPADGRPTARAVRRTGNPFRSARDLNCLRANWRPRPASGIKMPAQMPSAAGVSQAS